MHVVTASLIHASILQALEEAANKELNSIHKQQQEAEAHASNLAIVQQMNPEEQTWQGTHAASGGTMLLTQACCLADDSAYLDCYQE